VPLLYSTALTRFRPRASRLGCTLQRSRACGPGPRASAVLYSAHALAALGLVPLRYSTALTRLWPWPPFLLYSTALKRLRPRSSYLRCTLQRLRACGLGPRASVLLSGLGPRVPRLYSTALARSCSLGPSALWLYSSCTRQRSSACGVSPCASAILYSARALVALALACLGFALRRLYACGLGPRTSAVLCSAQVLAAVALVPQRCSTVPTRLRPLSSCMPWLYSTALTRLWPWPSGLGLALERSRACGLGSHASAVLYGAHALRPRTSCLGGSTLQRSSAYGLGPRASAIPCSAQALAAVALVPRFHFTVLTPLAALARGPLRPARKLIRCCPSLSSSPLPSTVPLPLSFPSLAWRTPLFHLYTARRPQDRLARIAL